MTTLKDRSKYVINTKRFEALGFEPEDVIVLAESFFNSKYYAKPEGWAYERFPYLALSKSSSLISGGRRRDSHAEDNEIILLKDIIEIVNCLDNQKEDPSKILDAVSKASNPFLIVGIGKFLKI